MNIQGIVLDETNFNQIKACGFRDFRILNNEMHYDDEERYQDWRNLQQDKIGLYSDEYMMGSEDAKIFFFSDKEPVILKIAETFPGCIIINVTEADLKETYSLDYDYRNEE